MIDGNRSTMRRAAAEEIYKDDENFSTGEALSQYARLEGTVAGRKPKSRHLPGHPQPVENSMAPHATVAQNDSPAWHGSTVAHHATVAGLATVERYAMVKG